MADTVKRMFRILILSIFLPIVFIMLVEAINANVSGAVLSTSLKMAIDMGCEYYSQESYRYNGYGNTSGLDDIDYYRYGDSNVTITGDFYEESVSANPTDIYSRLYKDSSAYTEYVNSTFSSADVIGLKNRADLLRHENVYTDSLISPLNIGITYMDKDVLERVIRWNITSNLMQRMGSSGDRSTVVDCMEFIPGRTTPYYMLVFNGYALDIERLKVELEYEAFGNSGSERVRFSEYTGVAMDENCKGVVVARVFVRIPTYYVGCTGLMRNVMQYSYSRVDGLNESTGNIALSNEAAAIVGSDDNYIGLSDTNSGLVNGIQGKSLFYVMN